MVRPGPGTRHTGMVVTRPASGSVPDGPGSYQFVDRHGRVLYVGKAKSLRSRLNSYFQDPSALAPRTAQMVDQADHVEWMVVDSESEALLLEHNLIQQFQPRYNVRLKDDKSYPWLAITVDEEWPRPAVVRGRKRTGVRYFGPYPNVYAIRDTLDLLLRSFPIRSCSNNKFDRHQRLGRPCLLYHIERCSGPCVGAVEPDAYARDGRRIHVHPLRRHRSTGAPARVGHAGGVGLARVRAGLDPAGQARRRAQGRCRAPDGARASRGPGRHRAGRGRARGGRPGVPRPFGQGGRAPGPVRGQGRGPHSGRADRAHPGRRVRRRPVRCAPPGAGAHDSRRCRGGDRIPHRAARGAGGHPGPGPGA